MFDKLDCAFCADAGRTRNVIHRIAHQAEQIYNLIGRHAEFILNPGLIAPLNRRHRLLSFHVLRILPHADNQGVAHELAHILIIGDDDGLQAALCCLHGERADDIVSLVARRIQDRNVVSLADADDVWQLRDKVVRHFRAIGFVVAESLMAESLLARLENGSDVLRLLVLQ